MMTSDHRASLRVRIVSRCVLAACVSLTAGLSVMGCASSTTDGTRDADVAGASDPEAGASILQYGALNSDFRVPSDPDPTPSRFAGITLPTPTELRLASGAPGPAYWQQRVDYDIDARLDPDARSVSATARVTYHNNSPHRLDYLWIQLEQNLFRDGSLGRTTYTARARGERTADIPDFAGGYTISSLTRGGVELDRTEYGTLMRVELPSPIQPGQRFEYDIAWTFPITPKDAPQVRMGWEKVEQGTIFELAQWFPHVCVYDDVHGWNTQEFSGPGEFHTNFGSYLVDLTVPADHIVVGSGELQNAAAVLTPDQLQSFRNALGSDETVTIVGEDDIGKPATRPSSTDELTWTFAGDNMRTFAWASSDAFIWDAAGVDVTEDDGTVRRVLCQSFYPNEATAWRESTQMTRHSVAFYSDFVSPYPYTVASNVNGPEGGMEYPTIVFCGARTNPDALFNVTDHEFGHQWFPMMVSNDERRHVWMDEGFNTFMNIYSQKAWYEGVRGRTDYRHRTDPSNERFLRPMGYTKRQAIVTPPDLYWPGWRGFLGYSKPGRGLAILRDVVLGAERFDAAFGGFTRAWAFKHPQPADFFRAMEDAAGADLSWFWRGWFLEAGSLDQAIAGVDQPRADRAVLTVRNLDDLVMPVPFRVWYADGSIEDRSLPPEVWRASNEWAAAWNTLGREVVAVRLDNESVLPDLDRSNNDWGVIPQP